MCGNVLSASFLLSVLQIITALVVTTIAYFKWKFTYWQRRGVPQLNPIIPFGDTKNLILGKAPIGVQYKDLYAELKSMKKPFGGVYLTSAPSFLPVDPELIKSILQKDFPHFLNHGLYINERDDPLSGHLFNLEGQKWKDVRAKLTPTYTPGKMKMMFQTLVDCGTSLKDILDDAAQNRKDIEFKEIAARFTTDIIGSTAFGVDCNSLKNPQSDFRRYGRKIFGLTSWEQIKLVVSILVPRGILKFFRFKLTDPEVERFFMDVVRKTVEYRESNNIYRKDFMHLLLQLKNRGLVANDNQLKSSEYNSQDQGFTLNELTAHAFVFFMAGFETSSTLLTFTLYELAKNQDIQDKLRGEITTVLSKHEDKLTYEAATEMVYMEKILNESLRKYPPAPAFPRVCNEEYTIPGTSCTITKGTKLIIPVMGLHYDPEYYPNPEKYDPERFTEENKQKRPAYAFLPFGGGPRICLGLQFGILQAKVGLTAILKDYRVSLNEKTEEPVSLSNRGLVLSPQSGIYLNVHRL